MGDEGYKVVDCKVDLSDSVKNLLVKKLQEAIAAHYRDLTQYKRDEVSIETITKSLSACESIPSIRDLDDFKNILAMRSSKAETATKPIPEASK